MKIYGFTAGTKPTVGKETSTCSIVRGLTVGTALLITGTMGASANGDTLVRTTPSQMEPLLTAMQCQQSFSLDDLIGSYPVVRQAFIDHPMRDGSRFFVQIPLRKVAYISNTQGITLHRSNGETINIKRIESDEHGLRLWVDKPLQAGDTLHVVNNAIVSGPDCIAAGSITLNHIVMDRGG